MVTPPSPTAEQGLVLQWECGGKGGMRRAEVSCVDTCVTGVLASLAVAGEVTDSPGQDKKSHGVARQTSENHHLVLR